MTGVAAGRPSALEPARAALVREAEEEADTVLRQAHEEAGRILRDARSQAAAITDTARREGAESGRAAGRVDLHAAHRAVSLDRLAVQGEAYAALCRGVAEAVRQRCARSPAVRERLEERARRRLGPGAGVHPDAAGGVRAAVPGRAVDFTAAALATRAVEEYGGRVERLWRR